MHAAREISTSKRGAFEGLEKRLEVSRTGWHLRSYCTVKQWASATTWRISVGADGRQDGVVKFVLVKGKVRVIDAAVGRWHWQTATGLSASNPRLVPTASWLAGYLLTVARLGLDDQPAILRLFVPYPDILETRPDARPALCLLHTALMQAMHNLCHCIFAIEAWLFVQGSVGNCYSFTDFLANSEASRELQWIEQIIFSNSYRCRTLRTVLSSLHHRARAYKTVSVVVDSSGEGGCHSLVSNM